MIICLIQTEHLSLMPGTPVVGQLQPVKGYRRLTAPPDKWWWCRHFCWCWYWWWQSLNLSFCRDLVCFGRSVGSGNTHKNMITRNTSFLLFSFACFSPRSRGGAVPVKEGGRAIRQTWLPTSSYCPLGTGTWKDFLNIHCVAQNYILLCSSNQKEVIWT